jgi:hypothetical protein
MIYHASQKIRPVSGGKLTSMVVLQWQPTLTFHDPNPPITLEDAGGPPAFSGILKRWSGASFVKGKLVYFNGATFTAKPLKRWNGGAWVEVDATGV